MDSLELRAGPAARTLLQQRGLRADDVDLLVAASGGPKWLALIGLDRWLMGEFLAQRRRPGPLPVLGSSIGSWRSACLAAQDPLIARDRLLAAYLDQSYPDQPTPADVSREARRMLDALLDGEDLARMVANPRVQLHILVTGVRGRSAGASRRQAMAGLAGLALRNLASPARMGKRATRMVFHGAGPEPWTHAWSDLPTRHVPLTSDSLADALLASGSIPLLFDPLRHPAWPEGVLYDGGILDYHPLPRRAGPGLVLYPHFHAAVVPGWFDKTLRWRHSPPAALASTLLIAPSAAWLARLPGGRVPDRRDFNELSNTERVRAWRRVIAESERLGEELATRIAQDRLLEILKPF